MTPADILALVSELDRHIEALPNMAWVELRAAREQRAKLIDAAAAAIAQSDTAMRECGDAPCKSAALSTAESCKSGALSTGAAPREGEGT